MRNYGPPNPRNRVKILHNINVTDSTRYRNAVLIEIAGGRGDFCRKGSSERYCIMFEGNPLCEVSLKKNESPTILPILREGSKKGTLAFVEFNMEGLASADFKKSVEVISPLLATLEDGYYVIADTLLYPANGNRDYFYSLNGATPLNALCEPTKPTPYPAYIFPTEEFPQNIDEYKPFPTSKALAYYIQGYMTLLLCGHELAVNASMNGKFLPTMVILPCTKKSEEGAYFADLFVSELQDASPYHIVKSGYHRTRAIGKGENISRCNMQYRRLWQQYPLAYKKNDSAFSGIRVYPSVQFKAIKNQEEYPHYKGIMSVRVKNGRHKLIKKGYNGFYKLMLHDKPLAQVYEHWVGGRPCIAPAFGMEEGCEEIQKAVKDISRLENQSIEAYATALSPILKLLADGTYVIVDTTVYPTTGNSYFWEVPNLPVFHKALEECDPCYPRPAYIYPTLHPGCWKNDTEDAYKTALMLEEENPGRAICFYLQGYMSALLHGHSMAAMAAYSHKPLPALVIIPCSKLIAKNMQEVIGRFADVVINVCSGEDGCMVKEPVEYQKVPIIRLDKGWEERYMESWKYYPMPYQLMDGAEDEENV